MTFKFENQRALFPILAHKAQLSSCSQSALSTPVLQALNTYTQSWLQNGMDWEGWATEVNHAKDEFARLIKADAADIAVLSCVSDLASSVGSALDFPAERNEIVVGEIDSPSLGHVWLAHERRGAKVVFAAADERHTIALETYQEIITDKTRLVSVSHVSYYNGFKQDIAAITALAHAKGALVFVDAYQSVGATDIDVRRDGIDMLACGAQKFLLGCPGIAFLYLRPGLADTLRPTHSGWFGQVNGFIVSARNDVIRVAPHVYNTAQEVAAAMKALARHA